MVSSEVIFIFHIDHYSLYTEEIHLKPERHIYISVIPIIWASFGGS